MKRYNTYRLFIPLIFLALTFFTGVSAQDPPEIGPDQGEMYPDFHLPRLDGSMDTLSNYRGQKILLFQFASW